MPFYAYQCEQCDKIFEVRATIKEREAGLHPDCPTCHATQVKPKITAGLVMHGSLSAAGPVCGCGSGGCYGS